MRRERVIQAAAGVVCLGAVAASGAMVPGMIKQSDECALRYTDVSVEGAPPVVAIGTAIGALRGLIVDWLWIKVTWMKERGLIYELMEDSRWITKLQPRFAPVWAFHAHNMAYNVSVATSTEEERWEWVKAGIRLLRNEGLRWNPNNVELHKELAFFFAHKVEGYSDDAHLYYKTQLCDDWHRLLGEPPVTWDERKQWIKQIADAPETLDDAKRRTPGVEDLVDRLEEAHSENQGPGASLSFVLDESFLRRYSDWKLVTEDSLVAQELGYRDQYVRSNPYRGAFDKLASDPSLQDAWKTLIGHVRKRVLKDEYNMDPKIMHEFTEELGPIDWRSGQAHALYWARLGSQKGYRRGAWEENIHKVINNDRLQLQAMQALSRRGRITYDPFASSELPSRHAQIEWHDTIWDNFETMYVRYYNSRGGGGDSFISFLKNFMRSAAREAYRMGDRDRAQRILDRLDEYFGLGAGTNNNEFRQPIEVFMANEIQGEYVRQPELAPSEAMATLYNGFRNGVGRDDEDVWDAALRFVNDVIKLFKSEDYGDTNRFGRERIGELIDQLDNAARVTLLNLMLDPTVSWEERKNIWDNVDKFEPELRLRVWGDLKSDLERQWQRNPLSQKFALNAYVAEPPNWEVFQAELAREQARREQQNQQERARDNVARDDIDR